MKRNAYTDVFHKIWKAKEINDFLETYDLPQLSQDVINNLNRWVPRSEIKAPNFKEFKSTWLHCEFYQTLDNNSHQCLTIIQNRKGKKSINSFYKVPTTPVPKLDRDATKKEGSYKPDTLKNADTNFEQNHCQKIFLNTLKRTFTTVKLILFRRCRDGLMYRNQ